MSGFYIKFKPFPRMSICYSSREGGGCCREQASAVEVAHNIVAQTLEAAHKQWYKLKKLHTNSETTVTQFLEALHKGDTKLHTLVKLEMHTVWHTSTRVVQFGEQELEFCGTLTSCCTIW